MLEYLKNQNKELNTAETWLLDVFRTLLDERYVISKPDFYGIMNSIDVDI